MTHLMWLAAAALCLATVAAGQQSVTIYYCDRAGQTVLIDTPADEFLLVTAYQDSPDSTTPGMRCSFQIAASYDGSMFRVEVERNPSLPARSGLQIRDTTINQVLADTDERSGSDRRVPLQRTHLVTRPGSWIGVTFNAGSLSSSPAWIRLRRFVNCPPGWTGLNGFCFSPLAANETGGSGRILDFATSQAACNAMRSNLLMTSFRGGASYSLAQLYSGVLGYQFDAWVGLTDVSEQLRWLDGSLFGESTWPDKLRCASSIAWSGFTCRDYEQCAYYQAANSWTSYTGLVLDRCRQPSVSRRFACYMPRNGTDTFYPVPSNHHDIPLLYWLLPTIFVCSVVAAVLIAAATRRRRMRYAALVNRCDARQPILAVPSPGYDAYGRPVYGYGAAVGHVQHPTQCPPQYQPPQHQHGGYPPQYQPPQCQPPHQHHSK